LVFEHCVVPEIVLGYENVLVIEEHKLHDNIPVDVLAAG